MNTLTRLREILPFAAALYLATGFAHLQDTKPGAPPRGGAVLSSLKWHMLKVAANERSEVITLFPGN